MKYRVETNLLGFKQVKFKRTLLQFSFLLFFDVNYIFQSERHTLVTYTNRDLIIIQLQVFTLRLPETGSISL